MLIPQGSAPFPSLYPKHQNCTCMNRERRVPLTNGDDMDQTTRPAGSQSELGSPRRLAPMLGVMLACILGGCAAPAEPATESATPSATASPLTVLAIGDSIPFNSASDCPGCTGFVESYASALGASNGETYAVVNRSRHDGAQTADILEEVQSGSLDEALGDADVVIVSSGFNDQPPYGDEGEACSAAQLDTNADVLAAVLATTPECVTTQTAVTGSELAEVLKGVRERAPDASILVLTAYNAWTGGRSSMRRERMSRPA